MELTLGDVFAPLGSAQIVAEIFSWSPQSLLRSKKDCSCAAGSAAPAGHATLSSSRISFGKSSTTLQLGDLSRGPGSECG